MDQLCAGLTISEDDWSAIARSLQLSQQQALIARLILERELTSKEIARILGCTTRSVNTQIERMFKHLNIHSRVGLAWKVFREVRLLDSYSSNRALLFDR